MNKLQVLEEKENKKIILLAEIGALLHDLGKLSREFVEHFSKQTSSKTWGYDFHSEILKLRSLCPPKGEISILLSSSDPRKDLVDLIEKELDKKGWEIALRKTVCEECKKRLKSTDFDQMKSQLSPKGKPFPVPKDLNIQLTKIISDIIDPVIEYKGKLDKEEQISSDFVSGQLKKVLLDTKIIFNECSTPLKDFIEKHHDGKDTFLTDLIKLLWAPGGGVDGIDSGVDKGNVGGEEAKQNFGKVYIASAFGNEVKKVPIDNLNDIRARVDKTVVEQINQFNNKQIDIVQVRKEIFKTAEEAFLNALGETRRSANDVTLWDHSYSVASLYKVAVAKIIIDQSIAKENGKAYHFTKPEDLHWRMLRVNLDVLGLLSKGIKVADILSYYERIKEAWKQVKELVEINYPIGNEVYQDTTGIYFIFPDEEIYEGLEGKIRVLADKVEPELMPVIKVSNVEREINKGIREELKELLPQAIKEAREEIVYPVHEKNFNKCLQFMWDNLSPGKYEACPVCRLRPKEEQDEACEHCLERRRGRAEKWLQNSKRTIWLDEVADHNDRVALIVGCFDLKEWLDGSLLKTMLIKSPFNDESNLKNPSPARIRRIWNTTQDFIEETIFKDILDKFEYAKSSVKSEIRRKRITIRLKIKVKNLNLIKGSAYQLKIKNLLLDIVCINPKDNEFIVVDNLQLLPKQFGGNLQDIIDEMMERKEALLGDGSKRPGVPVEIESCLPADDNYQEYWSWIRLVYDFPNQFMVLVPAFDAVKIVDEIVTSYEKHFSKVRDRLPFHLGIVFFHRKTPLFSVMDAARRMLVAFKENSKDCILEVNGKKMEETNKKVEISFKAIDEALKKFKEEELTWNMSYATGDPDVPDIWHPYIRVDDSVKISDRKLKITSNPRCIHIKCLEKGDKVKIRPSFFSFIFLEANTMRFETGENIWLLDGLKEMIKVWDGLKELVVQKRLTQTKLRNIEALLSTKKMEWKIEDESEGDFEKLTATILKKELVLKEGEEKFLFFKKAILSGLFFKSLELYLKVLKQKLEVN